jgi:hypothetical protein
MSYRQTWTAPHDRSGLGERALLAVADAIASRETQWRSVVRHDPGRRWFARRYRTAGVEAWLLAWTVDQGLALHDHGGSAGAVIVLEGELIETSVAWDPGIAWRESRWACGSTHYLAPSHVHTLRNPSVTPATSLHVYSPPLSAMTFYERTDATPVPVRVEVVGSVGAAPW